MRGKCVCVFVFVFVFVCVFVCVSEYTSIRGVYENGSV